MTLTEAIQASADADHARMPRCAWCGRSGVPYAYRGVRFDGLTCVRGERLCPTCVAEDLGRNGVDIKVIDGRPGRESYVYNTVRDADKVTIRCEFADGRDRPRRKRAKRS